MAPLSRAAALLLLCAGSSGCLSGASHLGAAPTPRGMSAWTLAFNGVLNESGRSSGVLTAPELSWRHGMGEGWDLGFRAYALGLEVGTRHRLLSRRRLTLGVLPSLELAYTPVTVNTVEVLNARLRGALLADWRFAPPWTLTLGARLAFGGAGPATVLRGYGDGAVLLLQPEGLASLAFAIDPSVQLRFEAGVGVPVQLGGSARRLVGSGGFSLTWTRP